MIYRESFEANMKSILFKELSDCFGCGVVPLESDDLETFCFIEEGTNLEKCEISCNSPTKKAKGLKRSLVQVLKNCRIRIGYEFYIRYVHLNINDK